MAQLGAAFDSNKFEDMGDFEPIPIGVYPAQVTGSEIKTTKDGKGQYIKFEFTILSGEFKGRKIWQNLNIKNVNLQAVEIAKKELATLCRACGKGIIQDTQQLHGIPLQLKVGIKPAQGEYPAANKITGYAAIKGNPAKNPKKNSRPVEKEVVEEPQEEDIGLGTEDIPEDDTDGDNVPWSDD